MPHTPVPVPAPVPAPVEDEAAHSTPSPLWTLVIGGIAALGIAGAISAQTVLSMPGHGHDVRSIFIWQAMSWGAWAAAAPLILRLGARLSLSDARRVPVFLVTAVGALLAVLAHTALGAALALRWNPYVPETSGSFAEAFSRQTESLLPIDLLTVAMLGFIGWSLAVTRLTRQLEVRESRLEAELARARLEALRLEIQPHFLFNTLNAIAALIRTGSNARALEMLLKLSDLMRQTLDRSQEPLVSLDAEVAFTRQYLDLQRLRFGERLRLAYDIDEGCADALVPTLLLQPIVENALRHGASRVRGTTMLTVAAHRAGDQLRITVIDDGAGLPAGFTLERDAGTGLGNIRSRLQRLFGSAAMLRVESGRAGGTEVSVWLPLRRPAPQADVA